MGVWPFALSQVIEQRINELAGHSHPALVIRTQTAEDRAYQLFLSSLRPRERWEWQRRESFTVTGSDGRLYTIRRFAPYNVSAGSYRYCGYPRGVPDFDKLLAQKLLIETNALEFCSRAYRGSERRFIA